MIKVPDIVAQSLQQGAAVVLSVSGGKDSDAMTYEVLDYLDEHGLNNPVHLVHADLGRADLKATPAYVKALAARVGKALTVVQHSKYDLLDGIRHRMETRPDVPPWPSAAYRQCTSDWKRGPISKWIRNTFPSGHVICAMGLRADESPARAKKPVVKYRSDCCSAAKNRVVLDWLPLHAYTEADVWAAIGDHPYHEAYDRGNARVSCALCVLANESDLLNGALQDPKLFQDYCAIEIESGFSFRQNLWLGTLALHLLRPDQVAFYADKQPRKLL